MAALDHELGSFVRTDHERRAVEKAQAKVGDGRCPVRPRDMMVEIDPRKALTTHGIPAAHSRGRGSLPAHQ